VNEVIPPLTLPSPPWGGEDLQRAFGTGLRVFGC
jgi:hypothetical protein